jgi:hypothetical protein
MKRYIENGGGLLAISVVAAMGIAACGDQASSSSGDVVGATESAVRDADLTVTENQGDTNLSCEGGPIVCFDVDTNGANITHIFVDVDAPCVSNPDDYDVLLGGPNGAVVDKLHTRGGPCNHGLDAIDRDVWFPLSRNQSRAEVCIRFHGFVPQNVSLGAKAKSECVATTVEAKCATCGGGGAGGSDAGAGGSDAGTGGSDAGTGGKSCGSTPQ